MTSIFDASLNKLGFHEGFLETLSKISISLQVSNRCVQIFYGILITDSYEVKGQGHVEGTGSPFPAFTPPKVCNR